MEYYELHVLTALPNWIWIIFMMLYRRQKKSGAKHLSLMPDGLAVTPAGATLAIGGKKPLRHFSAV